MKVIKIHHPLDESRVEPGPIVLAMGFFDGVHKGHQQVLKVARAKADELGVKLAAITYDHHPGIVYHQLTKADTQYITPFDRRMALLEAQGVDLVYLVNFTGQFSALNPQEFVNQYLVKLGPRVVVAGFDHTYGAPGTDADMTHLADYATGRFEVETVGEQDADGQKNQL